MNLQVFNNKDFGQVRIINKDNDPWFVGKDVADILGYERPAKAILDHVDIEDKDEVPIQDSIGRMQKTPIINESGLYSLILSSKMPNAKQFKRWVTKDVIPSIRQHGAYMTTETIHNVLSNPDFIIGLANKLKEAQELNLAQDLLIEELQPKADYTDRILTNPGLVTITQIAKDYDLGPREMNKLLNELGVQYKQSGQWMLYRKYQSKGYVHSETIEITKADGQRGIRTTTKWTQRGRKFIYELLKANDIVPVIEKIEEVI